MARIPILYIQHVWGIRKHSRSGSGRRAWRPRHRGHAQARARSGAGRRRRQVRRKIDQPAAIATVDELPATMPSSSARRPASHMFAPMRNLLDQTVGSGSRGKRIVRLAACSPPPLPARRTRNTITSFHITLLHHGMIIVGVSLFLSGTHGHQRSHRGISVRRGPLAGGTVAVTLGERARNCPLQEPMLPPRNELLHELCLRYQRPPLRVCW